MGKVEGGTKLRSFGPKKSPVVFQVGRVCTINYGPDSGKICVVVDIVDTTQALVDGPLVSTGVARQSIPFARLSCLPIRINIVRSCSTHKLIKIFADSNVIEKWKKLPWARKQDQQNKRRNLTDFDRFKVLVLRKKRSALVQKELTDLKKVKYFEGRYNKNGKGKTLSKVELYWQAKKEGKDVEYPARKKRDASKVISKKRRRARSQKRSKKQSTSKLDARNAYSMTIKSKHKETAKKVSPDDKLKLRKKVEVIEKIKLPKSKTGRKEMVDKLRREKAKKKFTQKIEAKKAKRVKRKKRLDYKAAKKAASGDKKSKRKA